MARGPGNARISSCSDVCCSKAYEERAVGQRQPVHSHPAGRPANPGTDAARERRGWPGPPARPAPQRVKVLSRLLHGTWPVWATAMISNFILSSEIHFFSPNPEAEPQYMLQKPVEAAGRGARQPHSPRQRRAHVPPRSPHLGSTGPTRCIYH